MSVTFLFIFYSAQFQLPDGLLSSLCYVESAHQINAIHKDDGNGNSLGICQIKKSTAEMLGFEGTERDLMRPDINIYYAAAYLRHQINRYNSIDRAVIAYNIGSAKALTTTHYQRKVMNEWRQNEYYIRTNGQCNSGLIKY